MRLVGLSDTHGLHENLRIPDGDVLVFAGDFSQRGGLQEGVAFGTWWEDQPHKYKVLVPGNHDTTLEKFPTMANSWFPTSHVLINRACEIQGVSFWGSPVTPAFNNWAWNVDRGEAIAKVWAQIPDELHVLITHGPPHGKLDGPYPISRFNSQPHLGCEELTKRLTQVTPTVHLFGHLHSWHGSVSDEFTRYYNVAVTDDHYDLRHGCTIVDL